MAESSICVEQASKDSQNIASNETERILPVEAVNNFIQGKRHLLVQDYQHAVTSLEKACELYVQHYGQTAVECADVYFYYGKALFRLSQQEAGILGDALPEGSNDEEEEDEASGSEEEKAEENEENTSGDGDEDTKSSEGISEEKTAEATDSMKPDSSESSKVTENNEANDEELAQSDVGSEATASIKEEGGSGSTSLEIGPSGSQSKPSESEEDISDLQLAWETLETAKSIFIKQGDDNRDAQLNVAETLLILAEISMESENYVAGINDLKECLKIHQRYLSPDDRRLAETYYQMGLVYTNDNQYDSAVENFQKTMDVLMLRISTLKTQPVQKSSDGFDVDPAHEIAEIEALLPEIKAKLEDVQDAIQDTKKQIEELAVQKMEEMSTCSSSSDKPVTNITHLLKRKKPEDQDNMNTAEAKKVKLNASVANGDEKATPDSTTTDSTT